MAEFWNVATRPANQNGFGLSIADADRLVQALEKGMTLLPDCEAVYREWRRLVVAQSVSGAKVRARRDQGECSPAR